MSEKHGSNYEIMKKNTAELFLRYDQDAIIQKLDLKYDENFLYLTFLYRPHRVNRQTGVIEYLTERSSEWSEAGVNASMTIYDYLGYSKPDAAPAGEFCPLEGLNGVMAGSSTTKLGDGFLKKEEEYLDANTPALRCACEQIGGFAAGKGDVAWEFELFPDLPVRFQFWNSDEDFPAQITWFWDKHGLQFLHFETMWYANGYIMSEIQKRIQNATGLLATP